MSDRSNSVPWSIIEDFFECDCAHSYACEHSMNIVDALSSAAHAAVEQYRQRQASENGGRS